MKRNSTPPFFLEKHYLDFTDPNGNILIVYSAKLKAGLLKFCYSSFILTDDKEKTTGLSSWKAGNISEEEGMVKINNRALGINGTWTSISQYNHQFEYEEQPGHFLSWNCYQPISSVSAKVNGRLMEGIGYAETIRLTILPWKLPIKDIYWGRFVSPLNTVVWIMWTGNYPVAKAWFNGNEFNDLVVSDSGISFEKDLYKLLFTNPVIIRKGKIAELFSGMPWLKFFFRKGILNYVEAKFKSRAILTAGSELICEGWSIYEKVSWEN